MSNPIEISFHTSGGRPAVRYVSGDAVYAEALEHGRWIGLYWSASGQVQRENTTAGLPGLDSLHTPLQAFELEIDGQALHNRWEWVGALQRPGERPGTREAIVELRHTLRRLAGPGPLPGDHQHRRRPCGFGRHCPLGRGAVEYEYLPPGPYLACQPLI